MFLRHSAFKACCEVARIFQVEQSVDTCAVFCVIEMHELDSKASYVSVFCESINILSMWTLEISLMGFLFCLVFFLRLNSAACAVDYWNSLVNRPEYAH